MNRTTSKTVILPFRTRVEDSDASGSAGSPAAYSASAGKTDHDRDRSSKIDATAESQADGEA